LIWLGRGQGRAGSRRDPRAGGGHWRGVCSCGCSGRGASAESPELGAPSTVVPAAPRPSVTLGPAASHHACRGQAPAGGSVAGQPPGTSWARAPDLGLSPGTQARVPSAPWEGADRTPRPQPESACQPPLPPPTAPDRYLNPFVPLCCPLSSRGDNNCARLLGSLGELKKY
jgi:hypothetical protein